MKPAKIVVDQIIHDLQHRAGDFVCGECTLEDKKTGYRYWVANGFLSAGIHVPYRMPFGAIQGWRFHRALNRWKAAAVLAASGT